MMEAYYCAHCHHWSPGTTCIFCDTTARDEAVRKMRVASGKLVAQPPAPVVKVKRPSLFKQTWQRSTGMLPYAVLGSAVPAVFSATKPDADPKWIAVMLIGPVVLFFIVGMLVTYIQTSRYK